ncbi:hypothetical protein ACFWU5_19365 [Nocardia sp. NPDC058640]|uniref:hypothetical protein n=1 Tax=Nocardia sp. NPDC058640 TaxID=3346571 RepID=UPI00364841C5
MALNTKIDGDPNSIHAVASWLRDTLASQLDISATDLNAVRMLAESGWDGESGDAFATKIRGAYTKTDTFADDVRSYATHFDNLANDVRLAQTDMSTIRQQAGAAGLTVREQVIEQPGGDDPDKIAAFNNATQAADGVRKRETFWGNTFKNMMNDIQDKWFLVVGDLVGAGAAARAMMNSSMLRSTAALASSDALKALIEAKNATGSPAQTIYRDVDWSREQMQNAAKALDDADKAKATGKSLGFKVGGALAVAGIGYDIANGKPVEQAVVSGVAGFAASVAIGAAVGSIVPGPGTVVGAAAGAIIGAGAGMGAGIFTSGAVDSMYTEGLSVGGAVDGGLSALDSAGDAIGGVVSKGWNAIF